MGRFLIVIGLALLGFGMYQELNPPVPETSDEKAKKEAARLLAEQKKKAEDELKAKELAAAQLKEKLLGDENEAKGLNRDGSAKTAA